MIKIKICGLTNLADTLDAIDFGADYLGFNFYPDSPRYIKPEVAKEIFQDIPTNIPKVGVFVNEDLQKVLDIAIALELDLLQFHGDESPEELNTLGRDWFKAFRLESEKTLQEIPLYDCDWVLLDAYSSKAYGGTGVTANWDLVREAKKFGKKIILAGGINPENIEIAIRAVEPMMIDVASGVEEAPGKKDRQKMLELLTKAKGVKF
ncbi:MAG: phosphoribosylanthranilate isomerase [Deltaproteobacteria bacterium]|nr:phosphoribosylanthranilate isomerase [Deltaproteobacteria bacterium]